MGKKRSLSLVQENLSTDEGIINYVFCICQTPDGVLNEPKTGVFVVTNKRVIFASETLFSSFMDDIVLDEIESMSTYHKWFNNKMEIKSDAKTFNLSGLRKKRMADVRRDIDYARNKDKK